MRVLPLWSSPHPGAFGAHPLPGGEGLGGSIQDQNYYAEVEAHFIERRGSPLFITPGEWFLVSRWEEQGIPLDVVKEGIDRVFERPKARAKPRKLGYCRQTVEAAFRRFREVTLGGRNDPREEDHFDAAHHLQELAARLRQLTVKSSDQLAERIEEWIGSEEKLAPIEEALSEMDAQLLDAAEEQLEEAVRVGLGKDAEASLVSYRERMPEKVFESAMKSAYRRRIRTRLNLPHLTLYDR